MTRSAIIIDCQVLQTSAWTRGMGRYIASLIMGIYQNEDPGKILLLFNKNLINNQECLAVLKKVAPAAEIIWLDLAMGLSDDIQQKNSTILDDYINLNKLENSMFLCGSLFSFDYRPAFPTNTLNACIFYDMIPLKRWSIFYKYFPENEYFTRFVNLYKCDVVFSISETVRGEVIKYFNVEPDRVVNILGAEIPHFMGTGIISAEKADGNSFRYILLPGGNSPHKNMLRAIRGFDKFNAEYGDSFKLVITSFYSEDNILQMKALSPNIVLTGDISDSQLYELYEKAELILFPSLDEGLGLPILEAVGYKKPVACSDIPIFKEISNSSFYFFDPYNVESIGLAIDSAVLGENWPAMLKGYEAVKSNFNWKKTSHNLLQTYTKRDDRVSENNIIAVIVEQAGDLQSIESVARCVPPGTRLSNVTIYMDEYFERTKKKTDTPLILNSFIYHRDISEAPSISKDTNTVVALTDRSMISPFIGLASKARIKGDSSLLKSAINKTYKSLIKTDNKNDLKRNISRAEVLLMEKLDD